MKLEKQRVSAMRGIITKMKIGVYDSQEDLMKAVLEVLCSKGDSAEWQFRNNFNYLDFSEDRVILDLLDLARTQYGTVVEKDDYNAVDSEDEFNTLEA